MPSREEVLKLLDEGHTYETAGRSLHIPPGQAFMIATGRPADASDDLHPDELNGKPPIPPSTQHLVNPAAFNREGEEPVLRWVRERAARELSRPS